MELKIVLEAATEALEEVTVRAVRKMNSEVAMVNAVKASPVVMSAVSSQLITKSQDRDASEVVNVFREYRLSTISSLLPGDYPSDTIMYGSIIVLFLVRRRIRGLFLSISFLVPRSRIL